MWTVRRSAASVVGAICSWRTASQCAAGRAPPAPTRKQSPVSRQLRRGPGGTTPMDRRAVRRLVQRPGRPGEQSEAADDLGRAGQVSPRGRGDHAFAGLEHAVAVRLRGRGEVHLEPHALGEMTVPLGEDPAVTGALPHHQRAAFAGRGHGGVVLIACGCRGHADLAADVGAQRVEEPRVHAGAAPVLRRRRGASHVARGLRVARPGREQASCRRRWPPPPGSGGRDRFHRPGTPGRAARRPRRNAGGTCRDRGSRSPEGRRSSCTSGTATSSP